MADINDLEAIFSSRQGNTVRYLCEINSEVEKWQESPISELVQ